MDRFGFEIVFILFFLALGWSVGTWSERRHLASLRERERNNGFFLVTQLKSYPAHLPGSPQPRLIVAEAVIATDYFKSFLASIRRLFGGEVRSFNSLLDRARRETIQRLVEQARLSGYNAICNVRLETADVGGNNARRRGSAMVAILGSATAYCFEPPAEL